MKKLIYLIIATAFLFTSCEEFLDVNSDPNNPTEVTPELLLPVAQTYSARYVQENRGLSHLGNMMMYNWSQSYGFSWYTDEFNYQVTSTFYDDLFDDAYTLALKQYQDLVDLGEGYEYYQAVAKIMQIYHYQILVDLFGDIPYFDAIQRGANPTPVYDDAAEIYKDLVAQLTASIAMINDAPETAVAVDGDIMFDGDMAEWIKFANTVKLRILVRISDADAAFAKAEAANISADGFITDDVLVDPGYEKEDGKQNPFWNGLGWDFGGNVTMNHNATCATDFILDYLANTSDPRLDFMFAAGQDGHLGVPQGPTVGEEFGQDYVSLIGSGLLKSFDMGANILSLAESELNQALAINDGLLSGDAKAMYESGVAASFNYLGVSDTTLVPYLAQGGAVNVNYDDSPDKEEAIITQKWLATLGITAEQAWFDYSRTGFPKNLPISSKASTSDRPVRLMYPSSEITNNTANVPDQKDAFTDKIFWAQ